ncbi:DUF6879 family protein [Streptomyces sp. NPDC006602]|uniref:DUF6879 family protein n=1 Tax=Streptomyces sp. NPDC006602 TaxID=3364751 RepID=UPI0036B71A6B
MVRLLAVLVSAVLCVGIVVTMRFMASVANQLNDLRDEVGKRFADVTEATRLFGQVERLRGDAVPRLAAYATEVDSVGPDILRQFAYEETDRLAAHLQALTQLGAECPGENHDWLLTLTRCARKGIDAVSTTVDDDFWNTEPAARYLGAQGEAIAERLINVRRLFIVKRHEDLAALAPICTEQRQMGIQVRTAVLEELRPILQRGLMIDFIVFDGALSYQVHLDRLGETSATTINADAQQVEHFVRRFDLLWNAADPADL